MRHSIHIGHPGSPRVALLRSLVTGRARVYVDGVEMLPFMPPRHYRVPLGDGTTVALEISPPRWDGAESVQVDGRETWIARRLRWYEAIVTLAPLAMILGGAIPALIGAGALAANLTIIRLAPALWVRMLACAGVLVLALGGAVVVGLLFLS